jgi:hypothetical protein
MRAFALVFLCSCGMFGVAPDTSADAPAATSEGPAKKANGTNTSGGAGGGTSPTSELAFGTLTSIAAHGADEAKGGVSLAMVEIEWQNAEPHDGEFDDNYIASTKSTVDTLLAAGRKVTLSIAYHQSPDWLFDLENSRFISDDGNHSDEANLVFNQQLRNRAEDFLDHVSKSIDLSKIDAIRVTSGALAEVLYPDNGNGNYWAFDKNAQNGADMPPTMAKNPLPGWHPGDDGHSVDEVRSWASWYIGALDDVAKWQMSISSARGFKGRFQIFTPGPGVRPDAFEDAVSHKLPLGLLGVGPAWATFYAQLGKRSDVDAFVSVADKSGANGTDDACDATDASITINDPKTDAWSAPRYVARLATEFGYGISGANRDFEDSSPGFYVDASPTGMMATSLRQARTCGMRSFYWAHDDRLWDGTLPFTTYATAIAGH